MSNLQLETLPLTFEDAKKEVLALIDKGQKSVLMYTWQVGRIINEMQKKEGVYGSDSVGRMAEEIGKTPRLLQDMLRFYKAFPEIEYVDSMKIEWSHAREILRVPGEIERKDLIEKTSSENLTVRQVRSIVNKSSEETSKAETPKPKTRSPSPKAWYLRTIKMLDNSIEDIKSLMKKFPEVAHRTSDVKTEDSIYNEIVEGTDEEDALVVQISEKAISLASYLQTQVIPLRNVFKDIEDEVP